jgi:hypothetical protein
VTIDLVQWLTEQIDQDERVANAAVVDLRGTTWQSFADALWKRTDVDAICDHVEAHYPSRVLRQVAAYRRILAAVEHWRDPHPGQPCEKLDGPYGPCELHFAAKDRLDPYALRILVEIYSDRPGFDPSWTVSS